MKHLSDASFLGKLLVLPANVRVDWKVIASYEHSSLLGLIVSDKGKKFYNIDTWAQCYKTFYRGNLPAIPRSYSVMKQQYLGNYCGLAVNYHGICVTNVLKHNLT